MEQTTTSATTSHDSHSSPKQLTPTDAAVLAPCFEPSPARPADSQTTGRQWLAPLLRAPIRATALPTSAASNLSLSSLYALPKHSGRAGLFSPCHWYPVGGLLLVLALSRYVHSRHCQVDIHSLRLFLPNPHSPITHSPSVSFIALYGALVFFSFSVVLYCLTFHHFRLIPFSTLPPTCGRYSRSSWPTSTTTALLSILLSNPPAIRASSHSNISTRPAFRSHTCSLWLPPRTNSNPSHLCLHQCPLAIVMRCETTTHRKMHHDLQ